MKKAKRTAAVWGLLRLAAIFVAAFLILNIVLSFLADRIVVHSGLRPSKIIGGAVSVDALIVGNSRGVNVMVGDTSRGFPTTFNLSYNGLGRRSVIALTKEYFAHGNKAHFVLFEASALLVATPDCQVKSYWDVLPYLKNADAPYCPSDSQSWRYFPLTLYDTEIFLRATYFTFASRHGDQNWTDEYTMTPQACLLQLEHGDEHILLPPNYSSTAEVQKDVSDLRAWLRLHTPGTKLVFVLAPYLASKPVLLSISENVDRLDQEIGPGNYLNLATSLGQDCHAFADGLHIIGPGRAAIRPAVVKYLREQDARSAPRSK